MILIKNGLVKTMAGEDIENGQVLLDGDKIAAVGKEVNAPADAQVIDAAGCIVAPGFVEGHCHIGLDEEAIGFEGDDYNEMTDPVTPQMRGIDGLNPMDEAFFDAYSHGVTTAVTGPGSANVVGGTFLAVKLCGKRVDNMVVKNPVAMKIAFGENPKRCYGASQKKMPMTRMGTAALLRELLVKAQNYREEMDAYEADPKNNKKPTYDCKLHAMLPVMRKEIPLKSHAHRADDIFTALRIAKEFDLDITLDHCTEGHLIADELEKEGKGCLVGPTFGAKSKFELKNKCWDTPKTMVEHGLKTAIITDAPVIPLKYLPLCAGLAINAGLDEQEAWKAVTINPAVITGIADRVGSLEVGKDADVVIYKGNPLTDLQYTTKYTLINGQIVYQAE
ncbi:amidohydrolase [Intestinimonas butyriciproducens]|uniref:amidohydrolase n=1 Tax=Intestinimonas butyriciproducens TaxID=1297617 RepID=UPI0019575EE3|nr:amidohydrolase [Intestinimonas butyriciproducens]MBM6917244.1 amidohydrolase [Intestinimonas butyriciproducens]